MGIEQIVWNIPDDIVGAGPSLCLSKTVDVPLRGAEVVEFVTDPLERRLYFLLQQNRRMRYSILSTGASGEDPLMSAWSHRETMAWAERVGRGLDNPKIAVAAEAIYVLTMQGISALDKETGLEISKFNVTGTNIEVDDDFLYLQTGEAIMVFEKSAGKMMHQFRFTDGFGAGGKLRRNGDGLEMLFMSKGGGYQINHHSITGELMHQLRLSYKDLGDFPMVSYFVPLRSLKVLADPCELLCVTPEDYSSGRLRATRLSPSFYEGGKHIIVGVEPWNANAIAVCSEDYRFTEQTSSHAKVRFFEVTTTNPA